MSNMNDPVYVEIVKGRVKLLFDKPFFGQLAARLVVVDASSWCRSIACDGRHLYYNRDFIKQLSKKEILFVICHNLLHCIMDHLGRRGGRDVKIWDMATDYIVNYILKQENIGTMPECANDLVNSKYTDEWTAEQVYEDLKKNSVTIKTSLDEHLEPGKGNGDDDDKDGDPNSVSVTIVGKDGPPKLSEEDIQKIRNELRAAMIQTAQQVGAGNVPAGVRRMIDELVTPKMDWRSLLDAHIRSSVKDDYTFRRISRRSWGDGSGSPPMIMPAQDNVDTVDVAVAIDTSGSMTNEMLRDFVSEVKGIMETFRDFRLKLWTFDTQVYSFAEFTPENLSEIDYYQPGGGGGTMFEANWEFMKAQGIEPHRFVMFTDGYPGSTWGDEHYCDTLFVIHGTTSIVAPWGMTAYYDPND